jgi:tetratricopeptide (TPR) repeat protein
MKGNSLVSALVIIVLSAITLRSQTTPSEQVQVGSPLAQPIGNPPPSASSERLETQADELRAQKQYHLALDYYHAALAKEPKSASLHNKAGITELLLQNYREAEEEFKRAIKLDRQFANAYNNLGAVYYERKNYGKAISEYRKAIKVDPTSASFYSNLGAAYFSKRDWKNATEAYSSAIQLDPTIFDRSSSAGVTAQLASPEDRAHFEYVLAKIYAKDGRTDHALLCLRRALEGGYKKIDDVYKDSEFTALRKDPRFTKLMAARPVPISE